MDTRDLLLRGATLVLDPSDLTMQPDEFLSQYGAYLDTICLVAKSETGTTHFPSLNAPADPRNPEFFSSMARIANDIGIQVFALVNSHVDNYLSRDLNFQLVKSGGSKVQGMICPFQEAYHYYLREIIKEVIQYPIQGVLLKNSLYPRQEYCFCDNCLREFGSKIGAGRDFTMEHIKRSPNHLAMWQHWRVQQITRLVIGINQTIQEAGLSTEILVELMLDPQLQFIEGSRAHLGQDLNELRANSNHLLLHLYPWSKPFPTTNSPDYQSLTSNLEPLSELYRYNVQNSLFLWDVDSEDILDTAEQIKASLQSRYLFIQERAPPTALNRRSLHLDIDI